MHQETHKPDSEAQTHDAVFEDFFQVVKNRHSGRTFDATRSVAAHDLQEILEAARWAPSCYGDEPWRFIVCEKSACLEKGASQTAYDAVLASLVPFNHQWAQAAPILIVVVGSRLFDRNSKENDWFAYDTGASAQTLALAAFAKGLMVHQMAGFDPSAVVKFFGISDKYQVLAIMALGYESPHAQDSQGPRGRKPQESRFFRETWQE